MALGVPRRGTLHIVPTLRKVLIQKGFIGMVGNTGKISTDINMNRRHPR